MVRENRIIQAALHSGEAYSSLSPIVEEEDFSRHAWVVWEKIVDYYERDGDATEVDVEIVRDALKVDYPRHFEQFEIILSTEETISPPNAVAEYLQLKEQGIKHRLAECLLNGEDRGVVLDLMDRLKTITDVESDDGMVLDNGTEIDDIIDSISPDNIIKVRPQILADKLDGGLVPGNQVAIYANTEVGKTLFAINMACGLLQDGYRVLYLGNEDAKKMMLLRFYSNLSGMTKHEILATPARAQELAVAGGYNNLFFMDGQPGSVAEVRRAVEKCDPHVMFIDQMANMEMRDFSKVEKNEELSVALRRIAKRYEIVSIIVHQADNDAHGKLVLEKNNMHYTNVGVQGQMDVMIGIGMNPEYEQQGRRMLSLTKNKNSGNHDVFPITINQDITTVVEER